MLCYSLMTGIKEERLHEEDTLEDLEFMRNEEWLKVSQKVKNLIERMVSLNGETRPTIGEVLSNPWLSSANYTPMSTPAVSKVMALNRVHSSKTN